MRRSHPFQFRVTANAGVKTLIQAGHFYVLSARIQPTAASVGATTIGSAAQNAPLFATPLELTGVGGIIYDLSDFQIETANNGDGVDVFCMLAPQTPDPLAP